MFRWDLAGAQCTLQRWDIQPKNRHDKCEGDRWEEVQVLSCFVVDRWVLENAQAASAEGH